MLQKIIYTIFVINTINSFSDGIPQSEFNETKLLLSMSTQLSELRAQQEHQKQLIDGIIKTLDIQERQQKLLDYIVKVADIQFLKAELERQGKLIDGQGKSFESFVNKSDIQSLKEELELQKTDGVLKAADIKSLRTDLEHQKANDLDKESNIKSLKAELEHQRNLIDGQGKSFESFVNKSDIQSLKEELELQKTDGVLKAAYIKSLRTYLEHQKANDLYKESNIKSLKAELEHQRKLIIYGQGKSFNGLVNKSDIQPLKEDLDRQKEDGIANKAELERYGKLIDLIVKKSYPSCTKDKSSGVFDIRLFNFSVLPFQVFCDAETRGGGWTTILKRMDGSVDFHRNWTDYKNGFGNLSGEYFLGLDKIHALTSDRSHELLIVLEDFDGDERYETYDEFAIGDEDQQYVLHTLGKANGTAGDSLSRHRGRNFSTLDRDNDRSRYHCAKGLTSGWWHTRCYSSKLTGRYKDNTYGMGIIWKNFRDNKHSLKKAVMMIRPKN